ncbi:MAG: thermonuclease family protein [Alphaproteobacteria bacterium]|nr:thermonuclease family protein [Alphaproteobacteria bacterium]
MPPPRRMPRTPVSAHALEEREGWASSREVVGQAIVIDGERLRIGKTEMRLFGIVPPQLSASFGPQARAHIDALAGGQNVNCRIRDRDRDGRLLATCTTSSGTDMARDLLKRGLAVTARGSLVGTELAASYASAEQAAQGQKIGLWSLAMTSTAHQKQAEAAPAPMATPAPVADVDAKKDEKTADQEKKEDKARSTETQMQAKITADILSQKSEAETVEELSSANEPGFLERYQILVSGMLMLGTALLIVYSLNAQKLRDKREEIKALAAALRGELMAARNVCLGKAKSIATPADDRTAIWPRIRTTLYQAYVSKLGLLGADLARQIASIYGQSGDYAALYNPVCPPAPGHEVPKKQALETLIKHIGDVLPRLAEIEQTGKIQMLSFARHIDHKRPAITQIAVAPCQLPTAETEAAPSDAPQEIHHESDVSSEVRLQRDAQQRSAIEVMTGFWEHTRTFVNNLRSQDVSPRPIIEIEPAMDPNAAEYTAIIEADMERYQREAAGEAAASGRRK